MGNIFPGHSRKELLLLYPPGSMVSKHKPSTVHFGGFPGVCEIQNLIYFPAKDKGRNGLNFLLKNPNSKLFEVNQLRKGIKGGFSGKNITSAGP